MMEDTILSYVLVAVVFYFIGRWVGRTATILKMSASILENRDDIRRALDRFDQTIKEEQTEGAETVRIEVDQGMVYVYTEATNEFIAQGASVEEALNRAGERFPNRTFEGTMTKEQAQGVKLHAAE